MSTETEAVAVTVTVEIPAELEKVVKKLTATYNQARKLQYVRDPVVFAMYHAWLDTDRKLRRET